MPSSGRSSGGSLSKLCVESWPFLAPQAVTFGAVFTGPYIIVVKGDLMSYSARQRLIDTGTSLINRIESQGKCQITLLLLPRTDDSTQCSTAQLDYVLNNQGKFSQGLVVLWAEKCSRLLT